MSTHQLATGHPAPQGLHNPIFLALILLHCLKAGQTETYNTIIDNALHHPSSSLPHGPHPRRNPLIILKEPQGVWFAAVARQYQIREVLLAKVSI